MVFLADPTPRGERAYSNVWCGQAAAASVATDWLQRPVYPPEIDALIPARYRIPGGTNDAGLAAALRALGVPVTVFGWSMDTYLRLLAYGHQGIGLHQCDGWARPVRRNASNIAHWRRFYGIDGASIGTMNPWTAINERTSRAAMLAADLGVVILVDGEFPKDRPAPQPIPAQPEDGGQNVFAVGPGCRLAVTRTTELDSDNASPLDYSIDLGLTWNAVPGFGRTRHQPSVAYDPNIDGFVVWVIGIDGSWFTQIYRAATASWDGTWVKTTGSTR